MTGIDAYRQCHYGSAHPPHLWAMQTPGGDDWVVGCPGLVHTFHINETAPSVEGGP